MKRYRFISVCFVFFIGLFMGLGSVCDAANYPSKPIQIIVPFPAGGGSDVAARVIAGPLGKILGVSIQIVNQEGAAGQVGTAQGAQARPDGYTMVYPNFPTIVAQYLDPERKAPFSRKSFEPVALHVIDATWVAVRDDSPYRSLNDVVAAAKAKPKTVKVGDTGILNNDHIGLMLFEQASGVQFANVHFQGGAPAAMALLGDHVDVVFMGISALQSHVKAGKVRFLALSDTERSKYYPNVPSFMELGYKASNFVARGFLLPAGTSNEIIGILSEAIKKAMETEEHKKKMEMLTITTRYMNPSQFSVFWEETESKMKPVMSLVKEKQK